MNPQISESTCSCFFIIIVSALMFILITAGVFKDFWLPCDTYDRSEYENGYIPQRCLYLFEGQK